MYIAQMLKLKQLTGAKTILTVQVDKCKIYWRNVRLNRNLWMMDNYKKKELMAILQEKLEKNLSFIFQRK